MSEIVKIDKDVLTDLAIAKEKLEALIVFGVDNWVCFEDVMIPFWNLYDEANPQYVSAVSDLLAKYVIKEEGSE